MMSIALTVNAHLNPVDITRHAGVDAGLLHIAIAVTEADDTDHFPAPTGDRAYERAT